MSGLWPNYTRHSPMTDSEFNLPFEGWLPSKQPTTPLKRLWTLLGAETTDLWVILIFSVVVGILGIATPVAVEALVNTVAFGRQFLPVLLLATLLLAFLAFEATIRALNMLVVELLQRRLFIRVVDGLGYRLPLVEYAQFDTQHGPETVNRFFDVVTLQKVASALLLDGLSIVLQTIVGLTVLGFYHPFLLAFDVVLVSLIGAAIFAPGRWAISTAVRESKAKYAIAAWLEELVRHPTAFALNNGQELALERADELAMTWLDRRRKHFRVVFCQIMFAVSFQAVAGTALLGIGGWLVIRGELTLGQLVAAELIVMMVVTSFGRLGKHMESFYDLLASVDKLGQLFDLQLESPTGQLSLDGPAGAAVTARGVCYSYGGVRGLEPCDLALSPGEAVALVGPAGSGKSTLIDLLSGLRTPEAGSIELDGIDIGEIAAASLREQVAVSRTVEIFNGTLAENVHLHRPRIRPAAVREALQTAGLLDEALTLPGGAGAILQTNGAPLTLSQSQRLMLARALAGQPRLLLIDGTLDALPDGTIEGLLARIREHAKHCSLLVATSRLAIAQACDRCVTLATN